MNNYIKKAYENGRLVLLLGAGCSLSSLDQYNNYVLSSNDLAKKLAEDADWQYC